MFFSQNLREIDTEIFESIECELARYKSSLQLIASENFASQAVLEAQGSILTNKYAEGYPYKRYYSGCTNVDFIESLAIKRLCKLFNCKYANVQPHSGSQANQAVFNAFLKPNDVILGMNLNSGGHLTHGAAPNQSGQIFQAIQYEVSEETMLIDMNKVEHLAQKHKPKLIICGASAYQGVIDFKAFKEIADKVGAILLADIAHYAGLIAGGAYPSPFPYADVVTATTHKTLRGPRGGIIMTDDEEKIKLINKSLFPGLQGGPCEHTIAAKAVAFKEALDPSFKDYISRIISNTQTLANELKKSGFEIVGGSTSCHLFMIDLRSKEIKGNIAAESLERSGIICNKNSIPFDTKTSPFITSGLRFGTAAETTRGLKEKDFVVVASIIADVLNNITPETGTIRNPYVEQEALASIKEICSSFPMYEL